LDLGPALRDEIAQGAIREAETLGDLRDATSVNDDGAHGLIASLTEIVGLEKELPQNGVIHDLPSKMSFRYLRERVSINVLMGQADMRLRRENAENSREIVAEMLGDRTYGQKMTLPTTPRWK
jgi:hypothetical protein